MGVAFSMGLVFCGAHMYAGFCRELLYRMVTTLPLACHKRHPQQKSE